MKLIISPAKTMQQDAGSFLHEGMPEALDKTSILLDAVRSLSYEEAKELWQCSDKLAQLNFDRFRAMDLTRGLTPAILSYEGLQYQHMSPEVFTEGALSYIRDHLRILSGFYGVLRPFDGIVPYRLEMQAALKAGGCKNLYEFWGRDIYDALMDEDRTIINLASKEYSSCVIPYLKEGDRFLTVEFGELKGTKVVQKATFAKMARGEMVRFLAERNATKPEMMKDFHELGFCFEESLSDDRTYIFLRRNE